MYEAYRDIIKINFNFNLRNETNCTVMDEERKHEHIFFRKFFDIFIYIFILFIISHFINILSFSSICSNLI